jgi:hypothetical protein
MSIASEKTKREGILLLLIMSSDVYHPYGRRIVVVQSESTGVSPSHPLTGAGEQGESIVRS